MKAEVKVYEVRIVCLSEPNGKEIIFTSSLTKEELIKKIKALL